MPVLEFIYDRFLLSTKKKRFRSPGIKDCKVGNTPLIRLFHYSGKYDKLIYAKMESENPTRSAKDRVAEYILKKGLRTGKINSNSTIIEASSGNTGLALARIASLRGLKCIITIKDKVSPTKIKDLELMGAQIEICDSKAPRGHADNYITKAENLANSIDDAYYVNQNFNPDNANAHYETTGPEIWEQTGGNITHLVGALSTGGTLCGTAKYLKEQNPNIKIIGVDAKGSVLNQYYKDGKATNVIASSYNMDGVGKKFVAGNVDFTLIDRIIPIADVDAYKTCVELNKEESIYVGHSSGAVMLAIKEMIESISSDSVVVGIFPDHGSKYEKSIFDDSWLRSKKFI
jgi:cystathionine beta-synthase